MMKSVMSEKNRILYCHCAYAQVVPPDVKKAVLRKLADSGVAFEAVADLCEMSARRDAGMKRLVEGGPVKIAACYPRAVKWLFAATGAHLDPERTEILNLRVQSADEVSEALFSDELNPNVPDGKPHPGDAPAGEKASGQPEPAGSPAKEFPQRT